MINLSDSVEAHRTSVPLTVSQQIVRHTPHFVLVTAAIFAAYCVGLYIFVAPCLILYLILHEASTHKGFVTKFRDIDPKTQYKLAVCLSVIGFTRLFMLFVLPNAAVQILLTSFWSGDFQWLSSTQLMVLKNNQWALDLYHSLPLWGEIGAVYKYEQEASGDVIIISLKPIAELLILTTAYQMYAVFFYYLISICIFLFNLAKIADAYILTSRYTVSPDDSWVSCLKIVFIYLIFIASFFLLPRLEFGRQHLIYGEIILMSSIFMLGLSFLNSVHGYLVGRLSYYARR